MKPIALGEVLRLGRTVPTVSNHVQLIEYISKTITSRLQSNKMTIAGKPCEEDLFSASSSILIKLGYGVTKVGDTVDGDKFGILERQVHRDRIIFLLKYKIFISQV